MDKAAEQSAAQPADFLELVAWFHANRKRVITVAVAIAAIGAAIGLYYWHQNSVEESAQDALSNIKPPTPEESAMPTPAFAQPYFDVAAQHQGTKAAAHALLLGAGILFDAGKYDEAKTEFDKFLAQYPESPLAPQASVGVAASLEAQGKFPDATSRYEDLLRRHQSDNVTPQIKSALGRLYVAQNKPEQALRLYEELARGGANDTWSAEAGIQAEELLAKYPNLRKPTGPVAVPPTAPKASATVSIPTATAIQPTNSPKKP